MKITKATLARLFLFCTLTAFSLALRAADLSTPFVQMTPVEESPHFSPALTKPDLFRDYLLSLHAISDLCRQIDIKLSSVSFTECLRSDLHPSGAYSNKHKAIAFRDFKPADGPTAGRVLLIGGIHGDEYSSVSIVFKWLQDFEGDQFHWRVVPLLNPDGLLMPPDQSQRMNANGVDLNRNFPTPNWDTEAVNYWVNRTRKSKRRYPGPAALSEPESRWLSEQIDTFKPDAVISIHAPHGIVDFDGPKIPPDNLGPLELRLLGTYPGSMGRYIGVYKNIPLLTIELESALRLPEDEDVARIWDDTIAWLNDRVGTTERNEDTLLTEKSSSGTQSTHNE